eukprot:94572-Pleurochrysis_carterae.AAC.1
MRKTGSPLFKPPYRVVNGRARTSARQVPAGASLGYACAFTCGCTSGGAGAQAAVASRSRGAGRRDVAAAARAARAGESA